MSLVFTPGQLRNQSEFYRQLGMLTQAGISVLSALQQIQRNPPSASLRVLAGRLHDNLEQGATVAEAFCKMHPKPPDFDVALIEAGESSGRMDGCFRLLADYYENRARMAKQMISDLLYPAFLLHFAVFILPFAAFFQSGDLAAYAAKTLGLLVPLYVVVFLVIFASQSTHSEAWRALLEKFTRRVPLLGTARKNLALARLAAALEALISAGVPIFRAWELAAAASGSPALRREVGSWPPRFAMGHTPADVVRSCPEFPSLFCGLYTSGEVSGSLDKELKHLHTLYLEEGTRQMQNLSAWVPKIIYLIIVLAIAWQIVSFYVGYYGQINKIME
jgi:type II secretory pathway component PulF